MFPRWDKNTSFERTEYRFADPRIKKEVRIALLADLHNCEYGRKNERLLRALREEIRPDIIIIAGDLVESSRYADEGPAMSFLKEIARSFPVFYGVGNHEKKIFLRRRLRRQRDQLIRGLMNAGVRLLSNRDVLLPDTGIVITGLDLPHEYYARGIHKNIPPELLRNLIGKRKENHYQILIAHNPLYFPDYLTWGGDLILSGHVHGGLIRIPGLGGLASPEYKPFPKYDAGLYRAGNTRMLVSRGLGSHTLNLRIGNRPELPVIILRNC